MQLLIQVGVYSKKYGKYNFSVLNWLRNAMNDMPLVLHPMHPHSYSFQRIAAITDSIATISSGLKALLWYPSNTQTTT